MLDKLSPVIATRKWLNLGLNRKASQRRKLLSSKGRIQEWG